jgi:hypothetical protein
MRQFNNIPPLYSSLIKKNFTDAEIRMKRGEKVPDIFYEQMMGKDDLEVCKFIWEHQIDIREKLISLAVYQGAVKCFSFFLSLDVSLPNSLLEITPRKNNEAISLLLEQANDRFDKCGSSKTLG